MNARNGYCLVFAILLAGCRSTHKETQSHAPLPPVKLAANAPAISDEIARRLLSKITVEEVDLNLASETADNELIDSFGNKPFEQQFNTITVEHWQEVWDAYAYRLVKLAKERQMDFVSLYHGLERERSKRDAKVATIPVGAFLAIYDDMPVWIVIYKWELVGTGGENRESLSLGHIRIEAISTQSAQVVASTSCG